MGKPYQLELDSLPATYDWSLSHPVTDKLASWKLLADAPLVAIGSGGSFSAATFAAYLHEQYTGHIAKVVTPLEAALSALSWSRLSALLLTARGSNPDVLGAFRHIAEREPRRLGTFCLRTDSPLEAAARRVSFASSVAFELPSGKDGFLATNSLLATAVFLARLYGEASGNTRSLPSSFGKLADDGELTSRTDLWKAETILVLYSPCTKAAAVDLESKFSEAAICNVQTVDYRNFAHGRHHWLARLGDSTGVIAFVAGEAKELAEKTSALVPKKIPILRIDLGEEGPAAAISAIVQAILLAGAAGKAKGIDPGRPHVPPFGRKLYRLDAFGKRATKALGNDAVAVVRKSGHSVAVLERRGELAAWSRAHAAFLSRLTKATFSGLVLDYDGTLCAEENRFLGLDKAMGRELARLARSGAKIGIATGRGKSIRVALQQALPKRLWKSVVIGYYNGGDIGELQDDSTPDGQEAVSESLKPVAEAILRDPFLTARATFEFRLPQIKVEPKQSAEPRVVWEYLQQFLYQLNVAGVMALRSSHSMDVLAPLVSKQAVVEAVRGRAAAGGEILCIGDRGLWPGNDFTLLSNPHALSVEEVSPDPERCWNLAPPGMLGVDAALYYLQQLVPGERGLKFAASSPRRSSK